MKASTFPYTINIIKKTVTLIFKPSWTKHNLVIWPFFLFFFSSSPATHYSKLYLCLITVLLHKVTIYRVNINVESFVIRNVYIVRFIMPVLEGNKLSEFLRLMSKKKGLPWLVKKCVINSRELLAMRKALGYMLSDKIYEFFLCCLHYCSEVHMYISSPENSVSLF